MRVSTPFGVYPWYRPTCVPERSHSCGGLDGLVSARTARQAWPGYGSWPADRAEWDPAPCAAIIASECIRTHQGGPRIIAHSRVVGKIPGCLIGSLARYPMLQRSSNGLPAFSVIKIVLDPFFDRPIFYHFQAVSRTLAVVGGVSASAWIRVSCGAGNAITIWKLSLV